MRQDHTRLSHRPTLSRCDQGGLLPVVGHGVGVLKGSAAEAVSFTRGALRAGVLVSMLAGVAAAAAAGTALCAAAWLTALLERVAVSCGLAASSLWGRATALTLKGVRDMAAGI